MSRILIAIAAALLIGGALTGRVEAQGGWTCTWDFTGSNGLPSGWSNSGEGTASASGQQATTHSGYVSTKANYSTAGTTFTSASVVFSASSSVAGPRYLAVGVLGSPSVWTENASGSYTKNWSGSSSTFEITGVDYSSNRSTNFWVVSMYLEGTGSAPGGCVDATPTPTPGPTSTPAPTGVAYPTAAPFVGAAGDSWWGNQFNFQFGLQDWRIISGSFTSGSVISADVGGTETLEIEYPLTNARVTGVLANYYASCPHTFEVKDGNTVFEAGSVGSGNQLIDWQGDHVMANGTLRIRLVGSPACSGVSFVLSDVYIEGYGANPTGLQATAIAIQAGDLYGALDEVNDALSSLPQSLGASVPGETGRTLFGYVKWIVSPSSADELAGPFAPAVSHMGIFLTVTFGMALVYAIVWGLVFLFRFVIWIFKWILRIVDLLLQVAQAVGSFVGGIFKLITGGLMRVLFILTLVIMTAAPALAQMPPTPTALPPGVPRFELPSEFSLWAGTSTAIQVWNWIGDGRVIVQGLAIIGLVIAGIFIVYKFVSNMTRKDSEQ